MSCFLEEALSLKEAEGNLRRLKSSAGGIDFASNDYLGLARSARLKQLIQAKMVDRDELSLRSGSGGSRLLTGNSEYAEALEVRIAHFQGYEAGTLFNCGYMANVGLLSCIASAEDTFYHDLCVHASTYQGMRLSHARQVPFRHNDAGHLELRLKNYAGSGRKFVCIESVYSTDGSIAPLQDICCAAEKYGALLIVDEAHSIGIQGPQGKGLSAASNLQSRIFAQVSTFGKAPGVHGAIVLGSKNLKNFLINFSKPFIYTTAMPFHSLAAIASSFDLFPQMEAEREYLQQLIVCFKKSFCTLSETPIQAISIPGNQNVKWTADQLQRCGLDVRALTSPTVKKGREILRICLHAHNSMQQVAALTEKINELKERADHAD